MINNFNTFTVSPVCETGGEFHVSEIGITGVRLPPPRSVAVNRAFDLESVELFCERYGLLYTGRYGYCNYSTEILRVNDGRFNERLLQLLHNDEGHDNDNEPVDDSDEDPNYVVSDNELNQSESDDSFAVDEPQLEDEDDIHYSFENYLVQESEDDFFVGKDGSVWCRKEPPKQRRTPQHNILRGPLPGPTARATALSNNPLITRFEFIKRLTLKLVKPHITRRLEIQNLPRDIRRVITEYIRETEAANPNECVPSDRLEKRKTCSKCPAAKERKTNYKWGANDK
ncbi:hypothetical protein J6590_053068 [Homalodisca vitripennis]|nr:hypothetical protein J6590_053068 [Homalodisca vitripennis]